MGYTVILEAIMFFIKMAMKWSEKDTKRQKDMLNLVKRIDNKIITDVKFRTEYRKIIIKQLKEINKLGEPK